MVVRRSFHENSCLVFRPIIQPLRIAAKIATNNFKRCPRIPVLSRHRLIYIYRITSEKSVGFFFVNYTVIFSGHPLMGM